MVVICRHLTQNSAWDAFLTDNDLTSLPPKIGQRQNLQALLLDGNGLASSAYPAVVQAARLGRF